MGRKVSYVKGPIVVAYKTSDRKNAKTKLKIINNKNIDDLLDSNFIIPGINDKCVILSVGIGENFKEDYIKKYNID